MSPERNKCQNIQENIAWGREIAETSQLHIVHCPDCMKVFEDFTMLASKLDASNEYNEVPAGFANRVMEKIQHQNQSLISKVRFDSRPMQIASAFAAAVIGAIELISFIAWIVIPTGV